MKKKARTIFIISVICLGLLFLSLHLPFVRKMALDWTLRAAESRLGIQIEASSLHYNLLRLEFSVKAVSVRKQGEPGLPPIFMAERIYTRIPLSLLLGRNIHIKELDIRAPRITFFEGENGLTNFPVSLGSGDGRSDKSSRALPGIIIDRFLAQDLEFAYVNLPEGMRIGSTDGRLDIYWLGQGRHSLFLNLDNGVNVEFRGTKFLVETLALSADVGREEAILRKAALRSGRSEVVFSGRILDYFQAFLDFNLRARISLDDLKVGLHLRQELSGLVELESRLQGPLQAIKASADLHGENLGWSGIKDLSVHSELDWREGTLSVPLIRLSALGGNVEGNARFDPFDRTSVNQVELRWEDMDPAPLVRPLQLPIAFSTRSSGAFRATWTEPTGESVKAQADIHFAAPGQAAPAEGAVSLSGKAGLEAEGGKISLKLSSIDLGGASLGGEFQLRDGQLRGEFKVDVADIGAFTRRLPQPAEAWLTEFSAPSGLSGRISLSGDVEGPLNKPLIIAELMGEDISLAELKDLDVSAELAFDGVALRIQPLILSLGGSRAEFAGTYRPRSHRPLDLTAKIRHWPVESLLKISGTAAPASAELDLDSQFEGSLSSPAFDMKGRLSRVGFRREDLGDILFEAHSDGAAVRFEANAPSLSASAEGGLSFGRPKPLRIRLNFENLSIERIGGLASLKRLPHLSGVTSGRAEISAELQNLGETLAVDLHVSSLLLHTEAFRLASGGEFSISYGRKGLSIRNLLLEEGGRHFSAEGTLPRRREDEGIGGAGLDVRAALELGSLAGLLRDSDGEGLLNFKAQVRGSISRPEILAEVGLEGAKWSWRESLTIEDIGVRIELAADIIHIRDVSFRWREGTYSLQGDVPLESLPYQLPFFSPPPVGRPARLIFLVRGFSPADAAASLGSPKVQGVKGTIDGQIAITAERFSLDSFSASAEFSRFDLNLPSLRLVQEVPSRILFERGRIVFDRLSLIGGENTLQANGTLEVLGEKKVDLGLKGNLDLQMLQTFIPDSGFSGRGAYEIVFTESLAQPGVTGFIELHDAGVENARLHLNLSRLTGRLLVHRNRLDVEALSGLLNGGKVECSGNLLFEGFSLKDADLRTSGEDIFLDYPRGFFAQAGFALRLIWLDNKPSLGGTVTIKTAEYIEPFNIQSGLFRYLKRRPPSARSVESRPLLSRLNFDIQIIIQNSISVRNNIAKGQLQGDLRLSGTPVQPVLSGRVRVDEGGEIYFSRNTYQVEQGQVDFVNPNRIEPDINLQAHTRVSGYEIKLLLSGTPDKFSADLTSDPPLSEPDIISLLVTGRRLAYVSDNVLGAMGDRALSYLNDALTGQLESLAKQKLGLDSVTIDAGLVSPQENPAARLTVGRHITPELEFILSQSLKQSQYTTVILNYNPVREINLRGTKQDNDAYRFDVLHEIRFGLGRKTAPASGKKESRGRIVKNLILEGDLGLEESAVRRSIKLTPGRRFDLVKYHDDLEMLQRLYVKNGYLSRSIHAEREEEDGGLTLVYRIESGPKVRLEYEGAKIPGSLKERIRALWVEEKLRTLAGNDSREEIRRHFSRRGYYQVEVSQRESEGTAGQQVVTFLVSLGDRSQGLHVDFEGVRSLSARTLKVFLKTNRLLPEIFIDPQAVVRELERYCQNRGFLLARVGPPVVDFDRPGQTTRVLFSVDEGPRFMVGRIEFLGNRALADDVLAEFARIRSGAVFSPQVTEAAVDRLSEAYARRGFNDAEIRGESRPDRERAAMDLVFEIRENRQDVVGDIEISGNALTREGLVRRELALSKGDALDHYALNRSRKSLYDLGIFGRVQFTLKPAEDRDSAGVQQSRDLRVEVTELSPISLRYGFQYDTETHFGVGGELVNRNIFGTSQLAGMSFNLNRYEKGAKAFFRSHHFLGKKINSEFFTFFDRRIQPGYTVDRKGLTLQQQIKFHQSWVLSYNYSFERDRVFDGAAEELEASGRPVNVGRINFAVSSNTRDDIMNPTQGMFFSQSMDFADPILGSEVRFVRYFGQYFFIKKMTGPLSYALGLRLGLGKGYGAELPLSERFFAGGGTSLRGFGYNEVGPRSAESLLPVGGEALFILNQEFRCAVHKKFGAVLFLDIGNVYARIEDLNPIKTRETAGVGLRLTTRVALLRLDWGFKLDRRPGESPSEIHFSIGQAF